MAIDKNKIVKQICYTELVYGRINKKLGVNLSKDQIEEFTLKLLNDAPFEHYSRIGKNYYVASSDHTVRVTINANTFRIITVDRLKNMSL